MSSVSMLVGVLLSAAVVVGSSRIKPPVYLDPGESVTVGHGVPGDVAVGPGEQVTVYGATPPPSGGPSCSITRGTGYFANDWLVVAKGLTPGARYALWWYDADYEGGPPTYYGGTNSRTASSSGELWFFYDVRDAYTEAYVFTGWPAPYVDDDPRNVAECSAQL